MHKNFKSNMKMNENVKSSYNLNEMESLTSGMKKSTNNLFEDIKSNHKLHKNM